MSSSHKDLIQNKDPVFETPPDGHPLLIASSISYFIDKAHEDLLNEDPSLMEILCITHPIFTDSIELFKTLINQNKHLCIQYWVKEVSFQFEEKPDLNSYLSEQLLLWQKSSDYQLQRLASLLISIIEETKKKSAQPVSCECLFSLSSVVGKTNGKGSEQLRTLLGATPQEISTEMTRMEGYLFQNIGLFELLNKTRQSSSDPTNYRNLHKIINHTNNIVYGLSGEILKEETVKKRAAIISHCIEIAQHCLRQKNFNSLMELVGVLNSAPISRLKRTWKLVPLNLQRDLQQMQEEMKPLSSYQRYRQLLNASREKNESMVPFLGVTLTDLTLLNENPDYTPSGFLNVQKLRFVRNSLLDFRKLQQQISEHPLMSAPQCSHHIVKFLLSLKVLDEDELYEASLRVEPLELLEREKGNPSSSFGFSWSARGLPRRSEVKKNRKSEEEEVVVYRMPKIITDQSQPLMKSKSFETIDGDRRPTSSRSHSRSFSLISSSDALTSSASSFTTTTSSSISLLPTSLSSLSYSNPMPRQRSMTTEFTPIKMPMVSPFLIPQVSVTAPPSRIPSLELDDSPLPESPTQSSVNLKSIDSLRDLNTSPGRKQLSLAEIKNRFRKRSSEESLLRHHPVPLLFESSSKFSPVPEYLTPSQNSPSTSTTPTQTSAPSPSSPPATPESPADQRSKIPILRARRHTTSTPAQRYPPSTRPVSPPKLLKVFQKRK
eukprot:TRINITY_DN17449_c0_g1_i1.p1 TRINITY_DN17449_c0_g1~~TRINITY_DN17449_c0_g1_i1.p1  ORF type:complete len:718 (-),score=135.91 TRINITY_DN17449_c0_g1_i1:119-2272(-)